MEVKGKFFFIVEFRWINVDVMTEIEYYYLGNIIEIIVVGKYY